MSTETVVEQPKTEEQTQTEIGKKKSTKTGDLIMDIATEVESLTKTKAINEAKRLVDGIETDNFRLGGILKLIKDNSWFEGSDSFEEFVASKFGFQSRKAHYLISIYENLVTKMIPWEKVKDLGWTKLSKLAPVLTAENVDEWVAKATPVTVAELEAMLKGVEGEGEKTAKTTDDIVKLTFKLKTDQNEVVSQALAKAKGELHTEYDTVALENICAGYLGGTSEVNKPYDLDQVIQSTGFETLLSRVCDLFPEWDVVVQPAKKGEAAAEEAKS